MHIHIIHKLFVFQSVVMSLYIGTVHNDCVHYDYTEDECSYHQPCLYWGLEYGDVEEPHWMGRRVEQGR
jgi:hypothetical protein